MSGRSEHWADIGESTSVRGILLLCAPVARAFETLAGTCPATVTAPGSAAFTVPSFGWAVCRVSETAR